MRARGETRQAGCAGTLGAGAGGSPSFLLRLRGEALLGLAGPRTDPPSEAGAPPQTLAPQPGIFERPSPRAPGMARVSWTPRPSASAEPPQAFGTRGPRPRGQGQGQGQWGLEGAARPRRRGAVAR